MKPGEQVNIKRVGAFVFDPDDDLPAGTVTHAHYERIRAAKARARDFAEKRRQKPRKNGH